jgi:triosephosphate isomerase
MEIPETDDALRAALVAAGVKPMICQKKTKEEGNKEMIENKKRLQKVADKYGRKLVFLPDPSKVGGTGSKVTST